MYLLDTCTLLWLSGDHSQLSERVKNLITEYDGPLYFSAISAFEIAVKVKKKKLELALQPTDWLELLKLEYSLTEIPVSAEILMSSVKLPNVHDDPADRILIASAKNSKLIILSPDRIFKKYKEVETFW